LRYPLFFLKNRNLCIAAALLIGCSLLFFPRWVRQEQNLRQKLQTIPFEERCYLEVFFRTLISEEGGCYVLFGDKPAAMMVYEDRKTLQLSASLRGSLTSFSKEKLGFKAWQKYQHLFPFESYVIVNTRAFNTATSEAVFLIHKERLLMALSQNFTEFEKEFPEFKTPKCLLNAMIEDSSVLHQVCFEHVLLLGIILGFGKDNAMLFERERELENFLFPQQFFVPRRYIETPLTLLVPQSGFTTLEAELEAIKAKGDGVINPDDESVINWTLHYPLGFLVDTTKTDLRKLRAKCKQQRIKATRAYDKGDFLETTLRELTSNCPIVNNCPTC
jgi:hypothetical protein